MPKLKWTSFVCVVVCVCVCVGMQTGCLGVMLHLKSSCLACNWLVRAHMAAYMCARTNYAHTHPKLCHTLSHIQARTQLRNLFFVCHNCLRILDRLYWKCVCVYNHPLYCVCVCVCCIIPTNSVTYSPHISSTLSIECYCPQLNHLLSGRLHVSVYTVMEDEGVTSYQ